MKKNKKILFGILVGLTFILLLLDGEIVLAQGINTATPSVENDLFKAIKDFLGGIYSWITEPLAFLQFLTMILPALIVACVGFAFSLLVIFLGGIVVPPLVNALINFSLKSDVFNNLTGAWEVIRNFSLSLVSILLLLIGLATIFKLLEYEARKTLVSLIVAALLVSFSFTIAKKIIDVGNKFTNDISSALQVGVGGNYLGDTSGGTSVTDIYAGLLSSLFEHFANFPAGVFSIAIDESSWLQKVIMLELFSFSYWLFGFIGIYVGIVLFAFGLVFFLRLIYLTCLLIVSPIAFLTAGIRTKEIKQIFGGFLNWDNWWKEFLEWTFIGVILMIWLKVGVLLLGTIKAKTPELTLTTISLIQSILQKQPAETVKLAIQEAEFMGNGLSTFLPVLACAIALHIGVKSAPGMMRQAVEGVLGTVQLVTTAALVAGTAAITAGASAAAAGASKLGAIKAGALEGGKTFAKSFAAGLPKLGIIPEEFKPGVEAGIEAMKPMVSWAKRAGVLGKEAAAEERAKERKKYEDYVDNVWKTEGIEGVKNLVISPKELPVIREAALEKLKKEKKLTDDVIENPDFQAFLATPQGSKHVTDVLKLRPDLAPQFINPKTGKPWTIEEILSEIPPNEAVKFHAKALTPEVIEAMSSAQRNAIYRKGNEAQKEAFLKNYMASYIFQIVGAIRFPIKFDTSSLEAFKESIFKNLPNIEEAINNLRAPGQPLKNIKKAKLLEEITNLALQRKL
jgi:hypothetical protein